METISSGLTSHRRIGTPVLNNQGQIAFETDRLPAHSYYSATYLGDERGVEHLLLFGEPLPGGDVYSTYHYYHFSQYAYGNIQFSMNQVGGIAFNGSIGGAKFGTPIEFGAFLIDDDELIPLALHGQQSNDERIVEYPYYIVFNNSRQVVFLSPLNEPRVFPSLYYPEGLFLGEATGVTTIARTGQIIPDGSMKFGKFFEPWQWNGGGNPYSSASAARYTINDRGQVAFFSRLEFFDPPYSTSDSGVFLGDGHSLIQIAREGQAIDGASLTVPDLFTSNYDSSRLQLQLDNAGNVAFRVGLGILRGNGSELKLVVEKDQLLGDDTTRLDNVSCFRMNDSGQITFLAKLYGENITTANDFGIFQTDGTTIRELVREGQIAPDGFGTLNLSDLATFSINASGQLAFVTSINDPRYPSYSKTYGVFFYDAEMGLVQVARMSCLSRNWNFPSRALA